jgi:hypothetical protein
MLVLILGNGKTWVIVILGSFVALIPDFLYEVIKITYFPDPTDKLLSYLKEKHQVIDSVLTEDRRENCTSFHS